MEGERERADSCVFLPKKTFSEKAWAAAPHVQIIVKKRRKNETNPHLQKGASLRMKMKALLQSSVPYPTGDPLEKLSSSTPFYPQCRVTLELVTWVLSKCIKMCQNVSKCVKMYQNASKRINMYISKCIKTYQNISKCMY